ncbi:hypothetical protein MJT46_011820 [Ovis ammon polii x Ovis aries]|nr:hypothetical protein MJT46_011820 [Ovis ammon polii x Ovis aries]
MRRERHLFFPTKQGKDPSSRAMRRKRGSPGCVRDLRASSRVETGENVLDFLKLRLMLSSYDGDERDRLWWPQDWVRCDYPRDASVEMGLIYPLGENVLDFLKLWLMLSSYDGDERDRLWWPQDWNAQDSLLNKQRKDPSSRPTRQKRSSSGCGLDPHASSRVERGALDLRRGPQGPALVASGKASPNASGSGASLDSFPFDAGAKTCVEARPEPEDSSPVLTWILGYFWGLPKGRKEPSSRATRRKRGSYGYGRDPHASSRGETGILGNFLSCSKGVKDPSDFPEVRCDYPRDASAEIDLIYPGGLSHVRPWWESILLVKVKAVQGKQFPQECSESSGGLLEWWHDAGVALSFPVESPYS